MHVHAAQKHQQALTCDHGDAASDGQDIQLGVPAHTSWELKLEKCMVCNSQLDMNTHEGQQTQEVHLMSGVTLKEQAHRLMGQVLAKMSRLTLPPKAPLPGSRIWKVGSFSETGLPCRAPQG